MLLADALDLGEQTAAEAGPGPQQLFGEGVRSDLEEDLGEPEVPGVGVLAGKQPEPAMAVAERVADPGAEGEPEVAVASDVEIELIAIADMAEHPGLEGDEVDGQRQGGGAGRPFQIDERPHRVPIGIEKIAHVDPGLAAKLVGKRPGGRVDLVHPLFRVAARLCHSEVAVYTSRRRGTHRG